VGKKAKTYSERNPYKRLVSERAEEPESRSGIVIEL